MIRTVSAVNPAQTASGKAERSANSGSFAAIMQGEIQKKEAPKASVEFSKHAITRAEERGIQITPQLLNQLQDGVEKAQEKGATNILAMDTQSAFIVNIPSARVITAISQCEMKENIFTNIDGAVFL